MFVSIGDLNRINKKLKQNIIKGAFYRLMGGMLATIEASNQACTLSQPSAAT